MWVVYLLYLLLLYYIGFIQPFYNISFSVHCITLWYWICKTQQDVLCYKEDLLIVQSQQQFYISQVSNPIYVQITKIPNQLWKSPNQKFLKGSLVKYQI